METAESPLEVLSRAATMVQDCSPPDYDCGRACGASKELPTVRWRRDRREKLAAGYAKYRSGTTGTTGDAPLDMTTPRGLPPPYSQCAAGRPAKGSSGGGGRPSVITCARKPPPHAAASGVRCGPRTEQLSDPVIDEHFRRSLGSDYVSLFAGQEGGDGDTAGAGGGGVTHTGLSVDDHFAKALGDTWVRLQRNDPEASPSATKSDDSLPSSTSTPPGREGESSPSPTSAEREPSPPSLPQPRQGLLSI